MRKWSNCAGHSGLRAIIACSSATCSATASESAGLTQNHPLPRDAELLRLMQPARFGGFEYGFTELNDVVVEIGRSCGPPCSRGSAPSISGSSPHSPAQNGGQIPTRSLAVRMLGRRMQSEPRAASRFRANGVCQQARSNKVAAESPIIDLLTVRCRKGRVSQMGRVTPFVPRALRGHNRTFANCDSAVASRTGSAIRLGMCTECCGPFILGIRPEGGQACAPVESVLTQEAEGNVHFLGESE
jgi:hypothetical protein